MDTMKSACPVRTPDAWKEIKPMYQDKDGAGQRTDDRWDEVLPPENHESLGREILRMVSGVIRDKQELGLHEKFMRSYRLSKGAHWEKKANVPQRVANLCHVHLQRTVNTLTDNNPTFNVSQTGEYDNEGEEDIFANIQTACEFWWQEQEQQAILEKSVRSGEVYGTTIEKVIFNPDLEYGIGEVETIIVDPFHFGLYPAKCSDIQKADAALHYYPMSVREARRKWPKHAHRIKGDNEFIEELGTERREISAGAQYHEKSGDGAISTFLGGIISLLSSKGPTKEEGEEETLVVEVWCKDYTMGKDGNPLYKGYIRRITACAAGLIVVDDRSNPSISAALEYEQAVKTYLYDKFPFAWANSISEANAFWGESIFEQLDSLQGEVNKCISQISFHKDKAIRPKIINPRDSGVPNEHFTNIAGILNPSSAMVAQGIRYLEARNDLRDILEVFNLYKELFYAIGGTFELDQAQAPGKNVIAYKAIAALLERAATMLRGKIRNYSRMIRDRGRMYVSHMQNFYTEDRWISYDEAGETHSMRIRGTDMIVPARLTVVSGSTMPTSKIQQREEALELFKMGAIDQEELLEKIDWSGRAGVIKRMKEGPLFDFMERMAALGVNPQMIEILSEIASLDRKEFDDAVEQGIFPMLDLPQADPDTTLALMKVEAEVEKLRAETEAIRASVGAKDTQMDVQLAGIDYDQQKLEIERVKALADAKAKSSGARIAESRAKGQAAPGPERGLKSNNQENRPVKQ